MVTIPYWFIRYGLPTAFLLLATVTVLLVRAAIYDAPSRPVMVKEAPLPKVAPRHARTRSARASAYSVRSGDTLGTIAERFGTSVDQLLALNPGIDPRTLRVGQSIRVE